LNVAAIKKIKTKLIGKKLYYYKEIGSTNDEAKRLAALGVGEGTVVIAEGQTKGRGKPGRRWFSPKGSGVYLSIIIEPHKSSDKIEVITLLGTLASARAIIGLTSLDVKLKWPNDVMVSGKKIGGILTEVCRTKRGGKSFIVGIGLNVNTTKDELPQKLRTTTTSIADELGKAINRTALIRTLLQEFEKLYFLLLTGKEDLILDEWKMLSQTIGSQWKPGES